MSTVQVGNPQPTISSQNWKLKVEKHIVLLSFMKRIICLLKGLAFLNMLQYTNSLDFQVNLNKTQ